MNTNEYQKARAEYESAIETIRTHDFDYEAAVGRSAKIAVTKAYNLATERVAALKMDLENFEALFMPTSETTIVVRAMEHLQSLYATYADREAKMAAEIVENPTYRISWNTETLYKSAYFKKQLLRMVVRMLSFEPEVPAIDAAYAAKDITPLFRNNLTPNDFLNAYTAFEKEMTKDMFNKIGCGHSTSAMSNLCNEWEIEVCKENCGQDVWHSSDGIGMLKWEMEHEIKRMNEEIALAEEIKARKETK